MITGSDKPLMEKCELFVVATVTVTFAPAALRVPEAVPLAPATTLPIATGIGAAVKVAVTLVPVPETGMDKLGFEPFDVTVTFPLELAAELGANVTLKVAL
jgi:hypothetical protein